MPRLDLKGLFPMAKLKRIPCAPNDHIERMICDWYERARGTQNGEKIPREERIAILSQLELFGYAKRMSPRKARDNSGCISDMVYRFEDDTQIVV